MKDLCLFASDLHGKISKYQKLFDSIEQERPLAVFLGGDLLPSGSLFGRHDNNQPVDFVRDFLGREFLRLKEKLGDDYPRVLMIMGNDDPRKEEAAFVDCQQSEVWEYIHARSINLGQYRVTGYSFVPPTPFRLKDWERYDVSRYVDPGCIGPEQGFRTADPDSDVEYATIRDDLKQFVGNNSMEKSIFLFHSPPHGSFLDRAALDGVTYENVPVDPHVGSTAIRQFIEEHQPMLTLHGHIHESSTLTGHWRQQFGNTWAFSAAWEGMGLALVKFNLSCLQLAERCIL